MRDLSVAEEGWVLRVRVGFSLEEEDIVEMGIVGSLEIGSSDTMLKSNGPNSISRDAL